jgi:hypothetical protein
MPVKTRRTPIEGIAIIASAAPHQAEGADPVKNLQTQDLQAGHVVTLQRLPGRCGKT